MNNNLTDVTVVIDRSGSMISCQLEAENGVNNFIKKQREDEGECVLSLIQFDDKIETVHSAVPVDKVPEFKLVPRNMTALLDAVGRAITQTGQRLATMKEEDRPGLVVVLIVTDGHENCSREYTRGQISKMIEEQKTKYNWQFSFLGANQDAFATGGALGFDADGTSNYAVNKTAQAFGAASANVSRMKCAVSRGEFIVNKYTDDERKSMM